jgi:hypothetical protein
MTAEPLGKVVQLHKATEPAPGAGARPTEMVELARRSKARDLVSSVARPLPSRRQVAQSAGWWARQLAQVVPWLPWMLIKELRPIVRGLGDVLSGWSTWMAAADKHEYAKMAEGNVAAKLGTAASKSTSARRWISLILFVALVGIGVWAWFNRPLYLSAAAIVVVGALDWHGRRLGGAPDTPNVVLPTGPIVEGIPLSSLRASVEESFTNQGFADMAIGTPEVTEHGWRIHYHAPHAIDDDHLRQVERDLNIRRGGVTQIKDAGQAARGVLTMSLRDPLAQVVFSPDPGELSIHQPLPLGELGSQRVWIEHFLRTHFVLVGRSQSGKSSLLWQITDVLRRCPEQELDAIDLTDGPAFGASRRAFRKRAFTEDDAHEILDEAIALCKRRNAELKRLAEADDTPDDYEEKWYPTAAEPQRTILMDEFARIAATKDTKDDNGKAVPFGETLIGKVEYVLRYGAKAGVTIGMAGQGGTLDDFGTTVVREMAMLVILFACGRADVLWLFGKDARDNGYRPDLLEPANGSEINDAGKCFAMSATSRSPDPRRAYRLDQAEMRRRDRVLGSRHDAPQFAGAVDAVEVPPALAAVERAFADAGNPERIPTVELLEMLADAGRTYTADTLAEALRPTGPRSRDRRWRPNPGENAVRGYYLEDVQRAVRSLG